MTANFRVFYVSAAGITESKTGFSRSWGRQWRTSVWDFTGNTFTATCPPTCQHSWSAQTAKDGPGGRTPAPWAPEPASNHRDTNIGSIFCCGWMICVKHPVPWRKAVRTAVCQPVRTECLIKKKLAPQQKAWLSQILLNALQPEEV